MEFKELFDEMFGADTYNWVNNIAKKAVRHSGFRNSHQDDLRGEAFLALSECKQKFNPEAGVPFRAFAYTRVRGAMIDYLRKEFRGGIMDQIPLESLPCEVESKCLGVEKKVALKQTSSILTQSIRTLPADAQNLIKKRYVDDLPFEAVSSMSRSVAFKRHRKVLNFLKDQLAQNEVHSYQEAA